MPNQPIVAIETPFVFVDVAILLINGTEQNGAMQSFNRQPSRINWPAN